MPDEIQACEGHLWKQIELIQPKVVATLGNFATKLLSGRPAGITRVHGQPQETTLGGNRVILYPLYHPAAALYTPRMLEVLEADFSRIPELMGRACSSRRPRRSRCTSRRKRRPCSSGCSSRGLYSFFVAETETTSPAETEALAARVAGELRPGTSSRSPASSAPGKTTFVRGACRSLGVTAPVTSPTFTIGHRYEGDVRVSHLDLYRFAGLSHAEWGDLEPYFDDAVAFVEWPEAGAGVLPAARVRVEMRHAGQDRRAIRIDVVLILAFDTATSVATSALVRGDDVLGERATTPIRVLEDVDALLREAGVEPRDLDALAVGIGPGQLHRRSHGARSRAGARAVARHSGGGRLDACRARGRRAPEAVPLIDAKRRELFLEQDGEIVALPAAAFEAPGRLCVGDGAVRYREQLEGTGATIPPDDSDVHLPRARFHALLAASFGPADELQPMYMRAPDADRMLA